MLCLPVATEVTEDVDTRWQLPFVYSGSGPDLLGKTSTFKNE